MSKQNLTLLYLHNVGEIHLTFKTNKVNLSWIWIRLLLKVAHLFLIIIITIILITTTITITIIITGRRNKKRESPNI